MDANASAGRRSTDQLSVLEELPVARGQDIRTWRSQVAPPAAGLQPLSLIAGTTAFASEWLVEWHATHHPWPETDLACYSIEDVVVAGAGQLWLDGSLVTSPEVMAKYVAHHLDLGLGGNDLLHAARQLPIRTIDRPCLVALGHGTRVYGHFLLEMLFRILLGRLACRSNDVKFQLLLDSDSPEWLLRILHESLNFEDSDLVFFDPSSERVRLRQGLVTTRVLQDEFLHPAANDLLQDLLKTLQLPSPHKAARRVFIARGRYCNPFAPRRICLNESELIEIASLKYGFTPVSIEGLPWEHQIALFRDAEIVVGQAGSGLHNALFSRPGSRLGSIGLMNLVQSQIGALRGQRNGYYLQGFNPRGEFVIDSDRFDTFLHHICAE